MKKEDIKIGDKLYVVEYRKFDYDREIEDIQEIEIGEIYYPDYFVANGNSEHFVSFKNFPLLETHENDENCSEYKFFWNIKDAERFKKSFELKTKVLKEIYFWDESDFATYLNLSFILKDRKERQKTNVIQIIID